MLRALALISASGAASHSASHARFIGASSPLPSARWIGRSPAVRLQEQIVPRTDQERIVAAIDPIDIQILQQQLQAVRNLPRVMDDVVIDGVVRSDVFMDDKNKQPSFRSLFTHQTWARYTGQPPLLRWFDNLRAWRHSRLLRKLSPCLGVIFVWAYAVALSLPRVAPWIASCTSQMWIPLSLQGTAIGLMLVFRTNNAYRRLEEAREQWGKLLMLLREVSNKASVALRYDASAETCRYLCAFAWSLRDKLRDGETRDDILSLLLDQGEVDWVISQRSRPLAILSRIRRMMHAEVEAGSLSTHMHYFIETDLKEIDTVVESCERLFSSPIPPSMARHGMRSLTLWIMGLPLVLTNSMPALLVAFWTATTSYIFLGIDELGTQVEQPFAMMPLWQLCHLAQLNVEEALSTPDLPLRLNRQSKATPDPLGCQSGNPFGDSRVVEEYQ